MEKALDIGSILSFLRGGSNIDIIETSKNHPEMLARCVVMVLNAKYHRQNMCRAIIGLLNRSPSIYRGIAWQIIQKIQFSHLLELMKILTNKDNTKRLRHAIVNRIANIERNQLLRAFFLRPRAFRDLFTILYLPRERFNNKDITNNNYKFACKLSKLSINDALKELNLKVEDLLKVLHLPFEQVMNLVETPEEALELARLVSSDSFFDHGRWFRNIIGDNEYENVAMKKIEYLKNPLDYISKKTHLVETGALTPKLVTLIEEKADKVLEEIMKEFELDRLALLVDVSGSMTIALEMTIKLYEAFSRTSNIIDLIAFNTAAFTISLDRLREIKPNGRTSIGSSIVLLKQNLDKRKDDIPQAILMVTDLDENTPPNLNNSLKLLRDYNNPPLIVLHCGLKRKLRINYPHGILSVNDFHKGLIMQIMRQIARLTSKVAVKEKEMTKILVERKPLEEELGSIDLPNRPPESYKKGYLERVLCPN